MTTVPWDAKFSFPVGDAERHEVTFEWRQAWGDATVWVDGEVVLRQHNPFGFRRVRYYEFSVGQTERHAVVVEKSRKAFGAIRKQDFRVLVDGREIGRY